MTHWQEAAISSSGFCVLVLHASAGVNKGCSGAGSVSSEPTDAWGEKSWFFLDVSWEVIVGRLTGRTFGRTLILDLRIIVAYRVGDKTF